MVVIASIASSPASRDRTLFIGSVVILAAVHAIGVRLTGVDLASTGAAMAACGTILLFGLPHGTLDLELLKTQRKSGDRPMLGTLILYLAMAGGMYLVWRTHPVAALVAFIAIAVVHFAEDWRSANPFLAQGTALALLTAPAFLHRAELSDLFVALSGDPEAERVADIMLLLAPVSLAVAAVALLSLWQSGARGQASAGLCAIAGMIVLPPAIGFAAFFCLFHSPMHLRHGFAALPRGSSLAWKVVAPLTLAALGLAVLLFRTEVRADLPAQMVAASFMTLSILTVPHMAVPAVLAFLSKLSTKGRHATLAAKSSSVSRST